MSGGTRLHVRSVATRSVVELAPHSAATYLAVVHAADGVRFVAAAPSRPEVVRQLADYVRPRVKHTLWADDARHVRSLFIRGELEAAVEVYFGRVGERWDGEWLVTTVLVTAAGRDSGGASTSASAAPLARIANR